MTKKELELADEIFKRNEEMLTKKLQMESLKITVNEAHQMKKKFEKHLIQFEQKIGVPKTETKKISENSNSFEFSNHKSSSKWIEPLAPEMTENNSQDQTEIKEVCNNFIITGKCRNGNNCAYSHDL